jgi:hypothetical protein
LCLFLSQLSVKITFDGIQANNIVLHGNGIDTARIDIVAPLRAMSISPSGKFTLARSVIAPTEAGVVQVVQYAVRVCAAGD